MQTATLYVELDHAESSTKPLETAWKAFLASLPAMGYRVMLARIQWDRGRNHPEPETVTEAEIADAAIEFRVPDAEDLPLRDRIERLRKAAGNKVFSQRELAEELGVSRYQIRKALEG